MLQLVKKANLQFLKSNFMIKITFDDIINQDKHDLVT